MIEIELKYELKNKIECNLKPNKEKEVEDIYYDTEDYQLLKNGNLLNDDMTEVRIGYVELYLKKYNKEAYNLGIYKD